MVDFIRKRLQVFVSSTFTDLIHERQAAVEAILTAGHIPAGMELFTSGDESQMEVIKQWIEESAESRATKFLAKTQQTPPSFILANVTI